MENNVEKVYCILKEIRKIFKNKFNFGFNYIEYISVLLYLKYYDYNQFIQIYETMDNEGIFMMLDYWLDFLHSENNNRYLFSNIYFKNFNEKNYLAFRNILDLLYSIEETINLDYKSAKEYVAKAYNLLLEDCAKSGELIKDHEEFYTPSSITDLVINLLEPNRKEIYDPYCGSGNFLLSAKSNNRLFGTENNLTKYNICITNLFLNGVDTQNIFLDTDSRNDFINNYNHYDIIVSNPPFSQKNLISENNYDFLHKNNLIQNNYADYVYVLKMYNKLNINGSMAVLLPQGALFRNNEIHIREKLIKEHIIDAIISLPEKLFLANRIAVIIFILKKNKKDKNVLFIDASKEFITNKFNNIIPPSKQDKIIDIYKKRKEMEGFSKLVSPEEIIKNNFNFSIKLYIKENYKKEFIDITKLQEDIKILEKKSQSLEKDIENILTEI